MFDTCTGRFTRYADRSFQVRVVVLSVLPAFGLGPTRCHVSSDPHYRANTSVP